MSATSAEKKSVKTTANSKFYGRMYVILAGLIRKIFRVEASGLENEPTDGAFLVCPNHTSALDTVIVAACLKHQIRYFAKAELFRIPVLAPLIRALGAFPVKRGQGDVGAVKNAIGLIESGEVVGLYPQGTRCAGVDPRTTKPKHGVAMIAYRSHADILPVCVETKGFKIKPFKRTYVRVGKLIKNEDLGIASPTPGEYAKASDIIFKGITDLLEVPFDGIKENK